MGLTIDQALQKAVEAHKAGQLQEADRLYTAILEAQPENPDANHNLGLIAVSVGKASEALAFLKTALEANPNIAQFWLSYIDTLIKLDRIADAKSVLYQAKSKGFMFDSFDKLGERLHEADQVFLEANHIATEIQPEQPNILDSLNMNQAMKLAKKKTLDGDPEEAKRIYQDVLAKFPKNKRAKDGLRGLAYSSNNNLSKIQDPPQDQLLLLNNLYSQRQLEKAFNQANTLLKQFPNSATLFNICGVVLKALGQLDLSVEAYNKALAINPDHAEAFYNMGNALKEQGKMEDAIEAYKKAQAINPNNPEVFYNMGNALKEQGKLEDAIEAYNKTLTIKSNHTEACNNMGIALKDQGKMEEAIAAYNKALAINPDYAEAWNNIVFPLQVIKLNISCSDELNSYYPNDTGFTHYEFFTATLNYILSLGSVHAESTFNEALKVSGNFTKIVMNNPNFDSAKISSKISLPETVIALIHWGRSGTGLLHSLVDDHPQISTLPSIYLSEYFSHSIWEQIIADGWSQMVDRFMSIFDVLFDANSKVPVPSKGLKMLHDIGLKEGMANVGEHRDEALRVNKEFFHAELNRLMSFYDQVDALLFFKLVHRAYDQVTSNVNEKKLIFYHIHNPDTHAQLNFAGLNRKARWVMMVREPLQSCESWLREEFRKNDYTGITVKIRTMLFQIDNIIYTKQNSVGVRLEDLKERPRQTIPALCNWMDIEESASLYEMTAQGKKWWGDPTSPDYVKDGMKPFGKTSINRKIGSIFSERDQYILQTLFHPFSVHFGYVADNTEKFEFDLQKIRPMLDEMFDFERTIVAKTQVDPERFMKSGSYLYLRSGLIERWGILNEFGTYPNMIKQLKI